MPSARNLTREMKIQKAAADATPRRPIQVCGGQLHKLQPASLSAESKRPPFLAAVFVGNGAAVAKIIVSRRSY
jgi:hypothetical protein